MMWLRLVLGSSAARHGVVEGLARGGVRRLLTVRGTTTVAILLEVVHLVGCGTRALLIRATGAVVEVERLELGLTRVKPRGAKLLRLAPLPVLVVLLVLLGHSSHVMQLFRNGLVATLHDFAQILHQTELLTGKE